MPAARPARALGPAVDHPWTRSGVTRGRPPRLPFGLPPPRPGHPQRRGSPKSDAWREKPCEPMPFEETEPVRPSVVGQLILGRPSNAARPAPTTATFSSAW